MHGYNKYRNDSIRLKNYNYSLEGSYFITICTKNRECLFGNMDNGKMVLNDAGSMLRKWYFEMENKYPDIRCREYVTMPNHFHCIIAIIRNFDTNSRTPDANDCNRKIYNVIPDAHVGAPLRGRPSPEKRGDLGFRGNPIAEKRDQSYGPNNKKYNVTIPQMVDWFKTMTTNEYIRGVKNYNWPRYNRKLWQQNYWEHIICNNNDLNRIRKYIKNNSAKWDID